MRLLTLICAGVALFALALGYAGQASWAGLGIDVAIGLLWLVGAWRGWDAAADLCMAGWIGLAALGTWQELPAGWMLIGVVAALAAWDLSHFAVRLRDTGATSQLDAFTRAHLRQLAIVAGAGLLLGGIALGIRVELTFGWAVLTAALAIIGISRLIRASGKEGV